MKTLVTSVLLIAGTASLGLAQCKTPSRPNPQSPAANTSATINGKEIRIFYSAPSVRGRKIFGGSGALQPDGSVWRLGADNATCLHTEAALDIGGVNVAPGDYSLYVDLDQGKWKLIVNKKTGQWGINMDGSTTDDPSQDVGRAAMTMSKPSAPVETLKITVSATGGNKGKIQAEWENVVASVPITAK
ncbi:MAG TPA: DUF2911 domain-containing protein [Bryobacteraceae bacterium]|jgi:hypothetical protein